MGDLLSPTHALGGIRQRDYFSDVQGTAWVDSN